MHPQPKSAIAPADAEKICVYLRAITCARFSPIESMLVMAVFERGWVHARFMEGCRKAMGIKLSATQMARLTGFDRPSIQKTRKSLAAGNVLVSDAAGFWRLNRDWRDWRYEDGRPRIGRECYEFITGQPDGPYVQVVRDEP